MTDMTSLVSKLHMGPGNEDMWPQNTWVMDWFVKFSPELCNRGTQPLVLVTCRWFLHYTMPTAFLVFNYIIFQIVCDGISGNIYTSLSARPTRWAGAFGNTRTANSPIWQAIWAQMTSKLWATWRLPLLRHWKCITHGRARESEHDLHASTDQFSQLWYFMHFFEQ